MRYELLGSMWLYLVLGATAGYTPFWRRTILVAMTVVSCLVPDTVFSGVAFFAGSLLADLSIVLDVDNSVPSLHVHRYGRRFVKVAWPIALFILSLFFASYPDSGADRMAWSRVLTQIAVSLFPNSITFSVVF